MANKAVVVNDFSELKTVIEKRKVMEEEKENTVQSRDGVYNMDILTSPEDWYIPTWKELGFPSTAQATRKGQVVYKNKKTGIVVNARFDDENMKNIADGYDPLRQYRIREVLKLNTGSLGVKAWFNFTNIPEYLKGIEMQNPVYADNNLMQYVLHQGLDYNSDHNLIGKQHVVSAYDGEITYIGFDNTSGHYVIVKHDYKGNVFYTLYMHLAQTSGIQVGTKLSKGEWFANVGNTGSASSCYSCHLHFEVRDSVCKNYYDPIAFFGVEKINSKL